jgi:hypothetical protein
MHTSRRWAYAQAKNITGGGMNDDGDVYLLFNGMLRGNVLPPELEAGIFRALKQIPGVKVETVDVFEQPALSLALQPPTGSTRSCCSIRILTRTEESGRP